MDATPLTALSPLDGRYASKCEGVRELFSEYGLIRLRTLVEVRWVQFLADQPAVDDFGPLSTEVTRFLDQLIDNFSVADAQRAKDIEAKTNHDVKAIEYLIAERLGTDADLNRIRPFVHFCCTSEDINNIAYALMLRNGREEVLIPALLQVIERLRFTVTATADQPMLSRTHGQTASPTTLGKEVANVVARLERQVELLKAVPALAKINGAVGNFNAHVVAYPEADWPLLGRQFIESLGLVWNPYTTQIEPHDWIAEYCDALARINTILIDASRDIWSYISVGYFRQRRIESEVGSSTMPHKVNPIDFENAEGNFGVANALFRHFAEKLPVSRWQRDLSDSTVLRNIGVAVGHSVLGYQAFEQGLGKLEPNEQAMAADLDDSWEVLAEAVQTVMRRYGDTEAYEKLKALTRGERIDRTSLRSFIEQLDLPKQARRALLDLTPANYTGLAATLARKIAIADKT